MTWPAISIRFLLGVVCLLVPARAFGHGSEYIFAKLEIGRKGDVQLELTADYGQNPMISGEDDAEQILRHVMRVRLDGKARELSEQGKLRLEKRTRFDATTPLPAEAPGEATAHELLTLIWRFKPASASIGFEVPDGNPHNVVFWTVDGQPTAAKPRWLLLISGEQTPLISIPAAGTDSRKYLVSIGIVAAGIVISLAWAKRFRRTT
jgi:hypothetical protein